MSRVELALPFPKPKQLLMTAAYVAVSLNIAGMALTGIGAFIAARAVMLTEEQATLLSGTYWDENTKLKETLLAQSASARNGLLLVVLGTSAQIASALINL